MVSTVVSGLGNVHPTNQTMQRKAFYAAGRFWVFYSDGTNMVFKSSTDGITWSAATTVRACIVGYLFSIWFDGTYVHYAAATGTVANPTKYRKGTPNSDGTITWLTEYTASPGEASVTKNIPTVTIDTNGYPWMAYSRYGTSYTCRVAKANALSGNSWPTEPWTILDTQTGTIAPVILSLPGGKMYAIWCYYTPATGKQIRGKYYDGTTWGSVFIITNAVEADWVKQYDRFSAAVDADGVLHLTYLTYSDNIVKYRKCTDPSTNNWTAPTAISVAGDTDADSDTTITACSINRQEVIWYKISSNVIYKRSCIDGVWQTKENFVTSETGITDVSITSYFQSHGSRVGVIWTVTGINIRHEFFLVPTTYLVSVDEGIATPMNFASNGSSQPQNFANFPSSVYFNGKTYVAWGGGVDQDPYVSCFNHATRQWATPVKVGNSPWPGDDHEDPAINVDSAGYLHVIAGGAHEGSYIFHYRSTNPEDITSWTVMPNIVDNTTPVTPITGHMVAEYPKIIINGSDMYFMYKYLDATLGSMGGSIYLRISHNNGTTWEDPKERIAHGDIGAYHYGVYQGHCVYHDGKIHTTWCYVKGITNPPAHRVNVMHAYYNIIDDSMYSETGMNFGQCISLVNALAYCKIVDTEADNTDSNHAALRVDADGHPWIIFIRGTQDGYGGITGPWSTYHINWTGAAWISPKLITDQAADWDNFADFNIYSYTNVIAYVITNPIQGYACGDLEEWIWNGWAWSKVRTVMTAPLPRVDNYGYCSPMVPANYPPGLGVICALNKFWVYEGNLPIYAYEGGVLDVPAHPGIIPSRQTAEGLGVVTDAPTYNMRREKIVSEVSISVGDSTTRLFQRDKMASEAVSFLDSCLTTSRRIIAVNEALGSPFDSIGYTMRRVKILSEASISVSDFAFVGSNREIVVIEASISVSDSVFLGSSKDVIVIEASISVSDIVTRIVLVPREISDSLGSPSDLASYNLIRTAAISETDIDILDSVDRLLKAFRVIAEPSISVLDSAFIYFGRLPFFVWLRLQYAALDLTVSHSNIDLNVKAPSIILEIE